MITLLPASAECNVIHYTFAAPVLGVSHAFLHVLCGPTMPAARKAASPKCRVMRDAFLHADGANEDCLNPVDCGPAGCRGFCAPPPSAA